MTFWITRTRGVYHFDLGCPSLRRCMIRNVLATEVPPFDPYLLCRDCLARVGPPQGFVEANAGGG